MRLLRPDFALWRDFPYEYERDRLAIDLISGSSFYVNGLMILLPPLLTLMRLRSRTRRVGVLNENQCCCIAKTYKGNGEEIREKDKWQNGEKDERENSKGQGAACRARIFDGLGQIKQIGCIHTFSRIFIKCVLHPIHHLLYGCCWGTTAT